MHAISFQLKRAHRTTVAFGLSVLKKIRGMTPARFDILCLLRQHGIGLEQRFGPMKGALGCGNLMLQSEIIEELGLHPATVSKMLTRLEEMGWIEKSRDYDDRRLNVIQLTAEGLRRTWEAMRLVFRQRIMLRAYEKLARQLRPHLHVLDAVADTYDVVEAIAYMFGDMSRGEFYPWGSRGRLGEQGRRLSRENEELGYFPLRRPLRDPSTTPRAPATS